MKPEMLQLGTRVMTPKGSGRVRPFFDEDPNIVVCQAHDKKNILCRIKIDETNDVIEFDTETVQLMGYV